MAKREFIDKTKFIVNLINSGFIDVLRTKEWEEIISSTIVTEDDIVKPYLDKLEHKIIDYYDFEAIPKADYEARLRADMVTMFTEIQLEIKESPCKHPDRLGDYSDGVQKGIDIIQQKINKMRGGEL